MVSGSLDMTLRVWDLTNGHQIRSLPVDSPIMSLVMATKDLALYGDKSGKVSFLNLESSACTHLIPSLRLGTDMNGMDKYRSVENTKWIALSIVNIVFQEVTQVPRWLSGCSRV